MLQTFWSTLTPSTEPLSRRQWLFYGLCMLCLLYVALFAAYPLLPPKRIPPNVQAFLWIAMTHSALGAVLLWCVQRAKFFLLPQKRGMLDEGMMLFCGLFIIPRLLMFPMMPWLSDDALRYIWDGNILAHDINPYLYTPNAPELASLRSETFGRELYAVLDYRSLGTIYPPLAQLAFATSVLLARLFEQSFAQPFGSSWIAAFYVWKCVLLASETLGIWLVWRGFTDKQQATKALAWYVLLPLPAIELAGQAHVDGLLLAPLGVLLLLLQQHKTRKHRIRSFLLGAITAVLGGIKILPAVVILPSLRGLPSWKARMVCIIGFTVTTLFIAVPFFADGQARTLFLAEARLTAQAFQFNGGVYYALCYALHYAHVREYWLFAPTLMAVLRVVVTVSVGVLFRANKIWNALLWSLAAVLLLSAKAHTWYFVPLLFLNVFVRRVWLVVLASGSLLSYSYYAAEPFAERYSVEIAVWIVSGGALIIEALLVRQHRRKKAENNKTSIIADISS